MKKDSKSDSKNELITLNRENFIWIVSDIYSSCDIKILKDRIYRLKDFIDFPERFEHHILHGSEGETVSFRKDILISDLNQILETITLERAKYYLKRLQKSADRINTKKINDINLYRWKEYDEIITDSLWIVDKRDRSGEHLGWYWGNFIPQIPRQMLLRYTKKHDWVIDGFLGSGTTLVECQRLGRNGIGIELNHNIAEKAKELIEKEENKYNIITEVVKGDNRSVDIKSVLERHSIKSVQLIIMHPPYHDIIKFSGDKRDMSCAKTTKKFLKMFGSAVENLTHFLEAHRYLAIVIGDKYAGKEWIPLGFYCMEEVLKRGYLLKSIIVKNFEETRGKRNQKELWRYRALAGGFYVFKHEYIMVFKKIFKQK
jgi:hypothetical protein